MRIAFSHVVGDKGEFLGYYLPGEISFVFLIYDSEQGMDVVMKMADAHFDYSWEYQGNAPKLVYTPLTDKCYLTLTQGLAQGYGGNPYGPAGTGKTESVKALGHALGRQVFPRGVLGMQTNLDNNPK